MPPPPLATLEPRAASIDRRDVLRRLVIGGAVVWTAPLISSTASAASATSCTTNTLSWTGTPGTTFNNRTVNGTTVTLSASSFYGGSAARSTNRTIIASPIGGIQTQGLRLEQDAVTNGGQNITLSFSKTVYAVSFVITDIDNQNNAWSDRVSIVSPASFTRSFPTNSTVTGTGTISDPFRNTQTNTNYTNAQPGGNVSLTFPGPLTSITIRFACANEDGSNQLINFSAISFCA